MDEFEESEMAWRLWNLMNMFQDLLWERYEEAFTDFINIEIRDAPDNLPF